ncbi:hypothetical protein J6590_021517, partial [Homalodisca vitripennis]
MFQRALYRATTQSKNRLREKIRPIPLTAWSELRLEERRRTLSTLSDWSERTSSEDDKSATPLYVQPILIVRNEASRRAHFETDV